MTAAATSRLLTQHLWTATAVPAEGSPDSCQTSKGPLPPTC